MDVKTAFLNGILKEELYMKQPPGYKASPKTTKDNTTEYVLKLNKSIYGLKQAPLVWNQTINKTLKSLGFTRSVEEPCIYYNIENNEQIFIALYVDDMLLIGTNLDKIAQLKKHLGQAFQMKDLGTANKFLGMNMNISPNGIKVNMEAAKRVLRYLKGTKTFGLHYLPDAPNNLLCYSDANLASETDTRSRSTTGAVILYGGSPVSWRSKLQTLVALSTANSELVALCYTTQECVWVQNLMKDLKIACNTKLFCDNQPAIKTVQLEIALEGTKHIRRRVDFIKQCIQLSLLLLDYVPTKLNCADIFTKAITDTQFTTLRQRCESGLSPTDLLPSSTEVHLLGEC